MTCIPPPMPGNYDAERIYFIVQDQMIVGMSGAVAINQVAIHEAMRLYRVGDRQDCFEKVVMVCRAVLKADHEQRGV